MNSKQLISMVALVAIVLFIAQPFSAQISLGHTTTGQGDAKTYDGTHKDSTGAPDAGITTKAADGTSTTTYKDGWTTETAKNELGETVVATKDPDGRLMEERDLDANGNERAHYIKDASFEDIYVYDQNHKLTDHISESTVYDAQGRLTLHSTKVYDSSNQLIGGDNISHQYANDDDKTGTETRKRYDPAKKEFVVDTPSQESQKTKYDYWFPYVALTNDWRIETPPVTIPPGFKLMTTSDSGLNSTTLTLPNGNNVTVNLPDEISRGDTITGTVQLKPAGNTEAERTKNLAELNGTVAVELGGRKTSVTQRTITCTIPAIPRPEGLSFLVNGKRVATVNQPVSRVPLLIPSNFTLPTVGQLGKPIEITGPCNGVFSPNDYVKMGGEVLPELAESPRKKVALNTSKAVGPDQQMECKEQGVITQGSFRNLGIALSAPKTNLLKGEQTTLSITVSGLLGIDRDARVHCVNGSPGTLDMEGGVEQDASINPSQVSSSGDYKLNRRLTGIQPGSFQITCSMVLPKPAERKGDGDKKSGDAVNKPAGANSATRGAGGAGNVSNSTAKEREEAARHKVDEASKKLDETGTKEIRAYDAAEASADQKKVKAFKQARKEWMDANQMLVTVWYPHDPYKSKYQYELDLKHYQQKAEEASKKYHDAEKAMEDSMDPAKREAWKKAIAEYDEAGKEFDAAKKELEEVLKNVKK